MGKRVFDGTNLDVDLPEGLTTEGQDGVAVCAVGKWLIAVVPEGEKIAKALQNNTTFMLWFRRVKCIVEH